MESLAGTQGPGMRVDGLIRVMDLCGVMEERRKGKGVDGMLERIACDEQEDG